jgi:hypothetical protein
MWADKVQPSARFYGLAWQQLIRREKMPENQRNPKVNAGLRRQKYYRLLPDQKT